MNGKDLHQSLEECLSRMQAGATLEEALRAYGYEAAELRPLLEAALLARGLVEAPVPADRQFRSRARFLAQAEALRQAGRRRRRGFHLNIVPVRALVPALIVLLVLVSSLFVTGLASAESLPGDQLYPVKIAVEQARLRLATDVAGRLSLEETFDQRRVIEVASLIERGREQQVTFAGFLSRPQVDAWRVAGIPVEISPQVDTPVVSLTGTYVEVSGVTAPGRVEVSELRLRLFHLSGAIESMRPQLWTVSGVPVKIVPETYILGAPAVGRQVNISAIRVATDQLLALSVSFTGPATPAQGGSLAPTSAAEVTVTATATAIPILAPLPTATIQPVLRDQAPSTGEEQSRPDNSGSGSGDNGGDHADDSGGDDHEDDDDDGGDD